MNNPDNPNNIGGPKIVGSVNFVKSVNFNGPQVQSQPIEILNEDPNSALKWKLYNKPPSWLEISPPSGTVPAGLTQKITITVYPAKLKEQKATDDVVFQWDPQIPPAGDTLNVTLTR